jgi:hypothetical protein
MADSLLGGLWRGERKFHTQGACVALSSYKKGYEIDWLHGKFKENYIIVLHLSFWDGEKNILSPPPTVWLKSCIVYGNKIFRTAVKATGGINAE